MGWRVQKMINMFLLARKRIVKGFSEKKLPYSLSLSHNTRVLIQQLAFDELNRLTLDN